MASNSKRVKAVAAFQFAAKSTKLQPKTADTPAQASTDKPRQFQQVDINLPTKPATRSHVAGNACIEGSANQDFPVPALIQTSFNVNAKHGGGTALVLATRGALDSGVHSSELFLVRCGYDGNHFSFVSLAQGGEHNFKNWNELLSDSDGFLLPKITFGKAHAMIISNMAAYGHGGCGVLFEGPDTESSTTTLRISPSPSTHCDNGEGGCAIAICSAPQKGSSGVSNQAYLLHFDEEGGVQKSPLDPKGSDKWMFNNDSEEGALEIEGPPNSHYAMYHSKSYVFESAHEDAPRGKVLHLQEFRGSNQTTLLEDVSGSVGRSMLLLCSGSGGNENCTTSALYQVTILEGSVAVAHVNGSSGEAQSLDVWEISLVTDSRLVISGPAGPCRYALFTNIPEDVPDPSQRCLQKHSLATGLSGNLEGGFTVDDKSMTVWVDTYSKVQITLNGRITEEVEGSNWMEQPDGRLAFQRGLSEEENGHGLKLFRAFAFLKDKCGADVSIELNGSPKRVIKQPPGVAFALNYGGPAYQALNDAVYNDTRTVFQHHDTKGLLTQYKFLCDTPPDRNLFALIGNTYDSYLFTSHYRTHGGFTEELKFDLPLPTGEYTMRLHSIGEGLTRCNIHEDGDSFTRNDVLEQLTKIPNSVEWWTGKTCEVPLNVGDNGTSLYLKTKGGDAICSGILIYDKNFKDPELSAEEKEIELKIKQEIGDKLQPLSRTFTRKEMKIAGWSPNLLENASGELGDMSHWNISGDFKVGDGGDGTEKMFITSYMKCIKSQEIDLTQHFSTKHLDSAPEIQASESFHEGGNQGGFYSFTVTLSDAEGNEIASKTTGEKGSITTPDWIRESFTFKDYGPGVRNITFESHGRDNKYWGGHFGSYISAGVLRVKTEVTAASDDTYGDVAMVAVDERKHEVGAFLRELTTKHKSEMEDMRTNVSKEEEDSEPTNKPKQVKSRSGSKGNFAPTKMKPRKTKREVRIFVSSTFRDFSEECEMIIKKVFRELNRICLDRGVFFTYVDLRWGITENQTKGGKTIEICLREVDKCRPYFICMMGDRYGWSQQEMQKDDLLNESFTYASNSHKNFNWVDEFRFNTSVTKLEVMYAAMRPHEKIRNDRIFFYLRQPRVTRDELPPPVDSNDPKDKPRGETQWHFDQQQKLRQSVLDSGHTYRAFEGAADGSAMIRDDLMQCIDEDFPPGTNLSHLERELEAHEAFAEVRRRVYIGGKQYFDYIDNYFEGSNKKPLTIIGESGSGKSALVANWCGKYEEKNPGTFLFVHFIGSSAGSASYLNLLRRLYDEMKQFYGLDMEVPSSDRNLVIDLPSWLKIAGKRSKVMIVLDALNQLDSGAGGSGDDKDLKWLPSEFPENVHMLLSTLPGQAQDAVSEFGWPMYKVEPLQENEKKNIISGYMGLYGKTLNQEQTDLIINAKQSSNPLYLKALLDEVRMYGVFEHLTTAIKSYLTADNPGALFGKILERLEKDFENGDISRPGLVRDTTVAIWCSRRGMSENELLTLLQVPNIVWSPFYLSLEENLINKNGIVNFFHDHLRQAVEARYLPTDEDKRQGYLKLANFFNAQDIDDRYADEMPYLLAQAGEKTRLRATILNILVFQILMKTEDGRFQLIKAWRMLGGFEQVEKSYLDVLFRSEAWGQSGDKVELIKCMAIFFTQLGLLSGARVLNERLLKELESRYLGEYCTIIQHHFNYSTKLRCNHSTVIDVLIELGDVCKKQGDLQAAERHLEDVLTRLTKPKTPIQKLQLAKALIGMGNVQRLLGQSDFAKKFLLRALEVSKEVVGQDHHYVAALVGQLGELCYDQGRLEEAMVFHVWDFAQTQKEAGLDHPRIAAILNNIGLVQDDMQDKSAEKTFKLALGILLEAYGKDHMDVATVRYNLGARFFGNNMYERARYQFQEAHRVFNLFLDDHPSTRAAQKAVQMVKDL